jgi:peptidoglycan hydrolase CwlO-like protein
LKGTTLASVWDRLTTTIILLKQFLVAPGAQQAVSVETEWQLKARLWMEQKAAAEKAAAEAEAVARAQAEEAQRRQEEEMKQRAEKGGGEAVSGVVKVSVRGLLYLLALREGEGWFEDRGIASTSDWT